MNNVAIQPLDRDHPAHKYLVAYLAQRMSDISEHAWYASWLIGLEFILWDAMHGGPREYIDEKDLRELEELSALVGGWHDYDRFIPLDEWLSIAREHALKLPAGDPS